VTVALECQAPCKPDLHSFMQAVAVAGEQEPLAAADRELVGTEK
jgi:hypothetical protein